MSSYELPQKEGPLQGGVISLLEKGAAKLKDYSALYEHYQNKEDLVQDYVDTFAYYVERMAQRNVAQMQDHNSMLLMSALLPWEVLHKIHFMLKYLRDFVTYDGEGECDVQKLKIYSYFKGATKSEMYKVDPSFFEQRITKVKFDVDALFAGVREVLDRELENVMPEQREAFAQEYKQVVHDLVFEQIPMIFQMDRALSGACTKCPVPKDVPIFASGKVYGITIDVTKFVRFLINNANKFTAIQELDMLMLARIFPVVAKYSNHYEETRDSFFLVLDQLMAYTMEDTMETIREKRLNKQALKVAKLGKVKSKTKAKKN